MNHKINIAIDGYSGCGKSSTAKIVAKQLGYIYIDTGAMYRAVTLYFLQNNIDLNNAVQVADALANIHIEFVPQADGSTPTFLNGKNVEDEIRSLEVSKMVSPVSTISAVRRALVAQQQRMGMEKGVVMDGRDIGTVVFPDAELKIFMTAEPSVRAARRKAELAEKGIEASVAEIEHNLLERDHIDSSRQDSPLKKADDALMLDTSYIHFNDQVQFVIEKAELLIKN